MSSPLNIEKLTAALAGRYDIVRELGAGGMATVYLARDVKHDREVAIKVLQPDLGAVLGGDRFLAEIKTTAKLQHPHILPLLDSGDANGLLFYVMPVVTGESLRARIEREGVLPIADAVRIATEIAGALDYAHRHGVVHRDIKPDNVLLHDGSALVADFGISLAVQTAGGQRMTQTGLSLGTPQYMSPEQAMGERNMDGRADVYALGAVTYEMLTGDPPFTGSSVQAILAKVMSERPTSIVTLRDTVPPYIAQAVHTALAKLPADRFATAAQFADALRSDRAVAAEPKTVATQPVAPPRRLAPILTLAAVNGLAVGALITALISWAIGHSRPRVSPIEPRRFSIVLPDSAPLVSGHDSYGNSRRALDLSRDGTLLVYVAAAAGSGTHLMLFPLNGKAPSALSGTDGASGAVFSPDGHAIAYSVGDEVRRRSLDDGATISLGRVHGMSDLSWIGDKIYASGWSECPKVAPASGGDLKPVSDAEACLAIGVAPVDDGSDWLLTSDGAGLFAISKTSGALRPLTVAGAAGGGATNPVPGTFPRVVPPGFIVFLRDSVLYAAPFDAKALQLTSEPHAVVSGMRREANYGQGHFAESSDGTAVWASGGDGSLASLVWADRTGRVVERLALAPAFVGSVVAAPDGKRIAVTHKSEANHSSLLIVDLGRHVTDSIALPFELRAQEWTRGGHVITVGTDSGGRSRTAALMLDGAQPRMDWPNPGFADESPDGAKRCDKAVVWSTARPADSVRFDSRGSWCRFSPDGKFVSWIARDGLFAAPVDARASERVKLAPAGADEPFWSRDGREVIYRTARQWFSVPSPEAAAGASPTPRLLFEGNFLQAPDASWALGPDGRFLLLEAPPALHMTRLEVMTGFPRFLQERLGKKE